MKINKQEIYKEKQLREQGELIGNTKLSLQQKYESLIIPLQEKEDRLPGL